MKITRISALLLCAATINVSSPVYAMAEKFSIQHEMTKGPLKTKLQQLCARPNTLYDIEKEFRKHTTVQLLPENDQEIVSAVHQLNGHSPTGQQIDVRHPVAAFKRPYLAAAWRQTRDHLAKDTTLGRSVTAALKNAKIYDYQPFKGQVRPQFSQTKVRVVNEDTISAILRYSKQGDNFVALNFANKNDALGGLLDGSMAQEEALGRSTDLFPSIALLANNGFYPFPEKGGIYINQVNILRDSKLNWLKQPVKAAFIFSAAYRCAQHKGDKPATFADYIAGTEQKIDSQFQMAIEKGHTHLILGAWGCGAFDNKAAIIANAYQKAINKYAGYFKEISFSIPQGATGKNTAFNIFNNMQVVPPKATSAVTHKATVTRRVTPRRGAVTRRTTPVITRRGAATRRTTPAATWRGAVTRRTTPVVTRRGAVTRRTTPVVTRRGAATRRTTPAATWRRAVTRRTTPAATWRGAVTRKPTTIAVRKVVASSKVAPKVVSPLKVAPKVVSPLKVAPKVVSPLKVAPKVVAPLNVAPKVVAPLNVAPKVVAPPKVASKVVVTQQKQNQLAVQKPVGPHQQVQLTCRGDYKLDINGLTVGQGHNDIVRSGVFLLKDYGYDEPGKPGSRYAVIVGHDANLKFWNFQAGKCEKSHKYTTETARDELSEETGGAVKMTARELSLQPYIYSAQKQLFFVRNDQLSVNNIKKACLKARSNPNLPSAQREIDNVSAISLPDLLKVAENMRQQGVRQSTYTTYSRTGGYRLEMEGYYMRMIANRLPEVRQILNNLLPGARL